MDTHAYPGRGLSLSQLIFALNEELKRVTYSPLWVAKCHPGPPKGRYVDYLCSFDFDAVSQIDRDASIALASIRQWRNSFIRSNRIPTDILSLIPTYLPVQKDRFHAASVCRHWRGVLLKCGTLWSQLFLKNGEDYVSTLLERAKGSALDIVAHSSAPGTVALISPRAQQIKSLEFFGNSWQDIVSFSGFNSGQLPLLRTLKIIAPEVPGSYGQPDFVTSPLLPLFRSSVDLEQFVFCSWKLPSLSQFIFPNLTAFELVSHPADECTASYLLGFLAASPMLQTVDAKINAKVVLRGVPKELVVILPKVETFSLHLSDDPMTQVYDIAAHISCPHARHTSLMHEMDNTSMGRNLEIFPTPVSWNTIVRQYTASPVEEVTLEIKGGTEYENIECSLTFRSSDATVVRLGLNVDETGVDKDELNVPRGQIGWEIFSRALTTIQDHPLMSHLKQLHIKYRAPWPDALEMVHVADDVRNLFSSLGPLDKLTILGCDLQVFFIDFLDMLMFSFRKGSIVFPQINELAVLHPFIEGDEIKAIVDLAKLQHALGKPFKRVKVRMWGLPAGMEEGLGQWVDVVDCREELDRDESDG